jgi:hypothetical protein
MHASLLKNAILFARMTKHATAPNDLVCYIAGRDFSVTRQFFFDPLHSHLPVGIQRFILPRYRRPSKYLKASILANNIFSFLSCIFLVCTLFPCFI